MALLGGDPIRRKCCLGIPQPTHATNRVWINPFVASCVGWSSVQVQYEWPALAISHPNNRRPRLGCLLQYLASPLAFGGLSALPVAWP